MERAIDNDKFIALIKARPCLWDTSEQDYSNRKKKQHCWIEVCKEMLEGFEELPSVKQNDYGKEVQKHWKNLRNCFARELAKRKNKPSGSGATWRTYIYFEQLSFLLRCPTKETEASIAEEAIHSDDGIEANKNLSEEQELTSGERQPKRKRTSHKIEDSSAEILELIKTSMHKKQVNEKVMNEDDDRHFLLSLLGDLKKVDQDRKMGVKLQIMQAIHAGLTPTSFAVPSPAAAYSNYYVPQPFSLALPHSFYPLHAPQLHQSINNGQSELNSLQHNPSVRTTQVPPVPKLHIPAIHSQLSPDPPPMTNLSKQSQLSPDSDETQIYDLLEEFPNRFFNNF